MDGAMLRKVDEFWARRLACEAELLRTPGLHLLVPDPGATRPGVFCLFRDGALFLRGDPAAVHAVASQLEGARLLPDAARVRAALGSGVERIIGPVFLGYSERARALPAGAGLLRALEPADHAALSRLKIAVTAEEWEHAGLDPGRSPGSIFGAFEEDRLLAAAGCDVLLDSVAHLGVLTHPTSRGRGAGRRAVAAAARAAEARGLLLQYQTLLSNRPSLRIAARLGFAHYGDSLAVRLRVSAKTRT